MIPSDPQRFDAIHEAFAPDFEALDKEAPNKPDPNPLDEPLPVRAAVLCAMGLMLLAWISVVVLG